MGVVARAVGGDRVGGDLHHRGDDVHAGTPLQLEALPHRGSIGAGLALDFELHGLLVAIVESPSAQSRLRVAARGRGLMNCVSTSSYSKRGPYRVAGKAGLGGLQKLFVVALREVGLVVRAARLIAQDRSLHNHPRKLQHVLQLPRKGKAGVGPLAAIAEVRRSCSGRAAPQSFRRPA